MKIWSIEAENLQITEQVKILSVADPEFKQSFIQIKYENYRVQSIAPKDLNFLIDPLSK